MQQTFALTLSPRSGRVSLWPVNEKGLLCQPFMRFENESKAQAFLDKHQAIRVLGGATINGTYRMDVPQEQEVSKS